MKRIVTVQDISCVGKCSLTVALPILSAMGIETAVIPTAVLSNHTAFKGFTFRDLTEDIPGILEHWREEGFSFDAVYSGYLGSERQIELVRETWSMLTDGGLKIVDPAMADNGVMYKGFPDGFADSMAKLCGGADIIIPNITEAAFMTHSEYKADGGADYAKDMLRRLAELGCRYSVLTGISVRGDDLGAMLYDSQTDEFTVYTGEKVPVAFHGTGDIFASCVTGAAVRGYSVADSMKLAVDYTLMCVKKTVENPAYNWYGVDFESAFPYLVSRLGD